MRAGEIVFTGMERVVVGRPAAAAAARANDSQVLQLSEAVSAALTVFARRHRVTLNTLFQAAWAVLLHRYSGEADVVFGATVSGRPEEVPGIEAMVGLFINTLPIRSRWPGGGEAVAWLRELQAWQAAVQQHAHTQLAEIQRRSGVPAGWPLFESIVVFENVPPIAAREPAGGAADLAVVAARYVSRTHYPLSLLVVPGERLTARATFERRRLEAQAERTQRKRP